MRDFNRLDPTALKAFYFASQTLNFTQAAKLAALTQSGVSQHISRLETSLGVDLFRRVGKKVQLTSAGTHLKQFAEAYLDHLDQLFDDVRNEERVLKGVVKYAMPESCLMSPHFGLLLKARTKFNDIDLDVTICHSQHVVDLVLKGEVDFGFVTKAFEQHNLSHEEFVREEYQLVGSPQFKDSLKTPIKQGSHLKSLNYVSYPGMDVLFERWVAANFPSQSSRLMLKQLQIRGQITSLSGAITLATHGAGAGVFPTHCIATQLTKKELVPLTRPDHTGHPIYIVKLAQTRPAARVQRVLDAFWAMK